MLASLLGGVIVLSQDDRISFVNPSAELLLQRSGSVLVGQPASALDGAMPWLAELLAHSRSGPESSVRSEGHVGGRSGTDAVAIASVLRDRAGNPDGTVIVLHDLGSRQWLYDDELARSRLAELDGLVSRVAHELNNPLAGIRGAAQMLGSKLEDARAGALRRDDRTPSRPHGAADQRPSDARSAAARDGALNIHRVLNDVILLAQHRSRSARRARLRPRSTRAFPRCAATTTSSSSCF